jgi:hypothetical protein
MPVGYSFDMLSLMTLTRTLNFRMRGILQTGDLTIEEPFFDEVEKRWMCRWSLAFVHPEPGRFFGDDPLDVLTRRWISFPALFGAVKPMALRSGGNMKEITPVLLSLNVKKPQGKGTSR